MFDHLMEVNKLLPTFEEYNLASNDVTFIKELIYGADPEENGAKKMKQKEENGAKVWVFFISRN